MANMFFLCYSPILFLDTVYTIDTVWTVACPTLYFQCTKLCTQDWVDGSEGGSIVVPANWFYVCCWCCDVSSSVVHVSVVSAGWTNCGAWEGHVAEVGLRDWNGVVVWYGGYGKVVPVACVAGADQYLEFSLTFPHQFQFQHCPLPTCIWKLWSAVNGWKLDDVDNRVENNMLLSLWWLTLCWCTVTCTLSCGHDRLSSEVAGLSRPPTNSCSCSCIVVKLLAKLSSKESYGWKERV